MRIRALSVFEGVVYHCWPMDRTNPCRPTLEVEAVLRRGDADELSGPLLVTVADYIAMVGSVEAARPCLEGFRAKGRIVRRLDTDHLAFPIWSRVGEDLAPPGGRPDPVADPGGDPPATD